MVINLNAEREAALTEQAQRRGVTPEALALHVLGKDSFPGFQLSRRTNGSVNC